MELVLYTIISWVVATYFITTLPKKDLIINIILYMLILIINISLTTTVSLNIHLIDFTRDKIKYLSVILTRNIITPLLLVICSSVLIKLTTFHKKIAGTILFLGLFLAGELMNIYFKLYTYIKWNFIISFITYFIFIFITVMLNKGLLKLQQRSEDNK
jgi:hypothetical protein